MSEIIKLVRHAREVALNDQSVSTKNCINRLCDALLRISPEGYCHFCDTAGVDHGVTDAAPICAVVGDPSK